MPTTDTTQFSPETTAMMLSVIFGYFSSPVIAIVLQRQWPTWVKTVVSHVLFVVIAALNMAAQGQLSIATIQQHPVFALITVVFTMISGNAGHHGLWRPTGVAESIETATTIPTNNDAGEGQGYDGKHSG